VRHGGVWYESSRVGTLLEAPNAEIRLAYEGEWLRNGFPISLSLPLSSGELDARPFFAGLLPEGHARARISRQLRLREDDDLGLLLQIGRDCAGALAVLPEDESPPMGETATAITPEDLARAVETTGQLLPAAGERARFSLAGAQDKLAVRIENEQMWLPSWRQPSSHILKFETIRWVCFAEYAANDMARRLGLPVPEVGYRLQAGTPPMPYLCIARYDRRRDEAGRLRRVHQEDITQALALSPRDKYEEDGGPNLGTIATLLRRHSADPVRDIAILRDWQLFNYLIGNSDGHAKNLALLYAEAGSIPRLAPLYDLVCIEFLNRLGFRYDRKLAFSVGNKSLPEEITRDDWAALARAIGVPPKPLLERLRRIATELPSVARATRESFAERFRDNPAHERLEVSIRDRCRWTLRSVFGEG
jgi:serine/threonine-protein kinase HipA